MIKKILFISILAAMFAIAGCGGPYSLTIPEQKTAEYGALKYSGAIGGSFVSCSGQDSNGDDYVTCTIKVKEEVQEILCSYRAGSDGCKKKT